MNIGYRYDLARELVSLLRQAVESTTEDRWDDVTAKLVELIDEIGCLDEEDS